MDQIHATAIIHPTAEIDSSAVIGPYCVIGRDVVIGERTVLHNHVTIQSLTVLGVDNQVYPFAVIGADPQDRKYVGERVTCSIGDRNTIREHVTIHRGTANGGGITRIGHDNLIMVAAHIAHDCRVADHICIANQAMLAGHVQVGERANIGGGAGLHHFTTVGAYSFVGGMSRITKDVPPFMIVEGNPAEVRTINSIAMTRSGYDPDHIEAIKDAFKRLYRDNGAVMSDKLTQLRSDYPQVAAIDQLCSFLADSAEGVHGRARENSRSDDKRVAVAEAATESRSRE